MRTLREIGEFVGVAEDSLEFGYPSFIGLRYAADVIARADPAAAPSMREIDAALTGLGAVTLEAQLLSFVDRRATVRVNTSQGLVIGTRILARSSAGYPTGHEMNYGSAGGDYRIFAELSPGNWTIIARRSGVGPTGYVAFERTFPVVSPPEEGRTEPVPVSQTPPRIEVTVIRDPERPWAVAFHITGSGFEANLVSRREGEGIHVRAVLRQQFQERGPFWTSSDADGRIDHTTGEIDARELARDAAGFATLVFSACDRRVVPPRNENLWSNAVAIEL